MDTLLQVLTIPEVAELWGKHPNTIRMAINKGYLQARRSRVWMISTPSIIAHWGKPTQPLSMVLTKLY